MRLNVGIGECHWIATLTKKFIIMWDHPFPCLTLSWPLIRCIGTYYKYIIRSSSNGTVSADSCFADGALTNFDPVPGRVWISRCCQMDRPGAGHPARRRVNWTVLGKCGWIETIVWRDNIGSRWTGSVFTSVYKWGVYFANRGMPCCWNNTQ